MKKILLIADSLNFKAEILDFAATIGALSKSPITGVFMEHSHLDPLPSVKVFGGQVYVEEIVQDETEKNKDEDLAKQNITLFKAGCIQREVKGIVHLDNGNVLDNIVEESRYADIIIVSPSASFNGDKKVPSKFLMDLLARAECSVLIAPEYFEEIDEIVLAYDGSRSSVYAIKQFQYQLPQLAHKKITVLHIADGKHPQEETKSDRLFKEWLQMNFASVSFIELRGNPREILFEYFLEQNPRYNKMLVTGAFGRNLLSSFFKPSTADLVLKAIDIPIFVSHH